MERIFTRTSRSSWIGVSMSSERRSRLPADQRRVTVPVNMDHNAKRRMEAKAQNLYLPFPKREESELSFFNKLPVAVDLGRESSSFISILLRSGCWKFSLAPTESIASGKCQYRNLPRNSNPNPPPPPNSKEEEEEIRYTQRRRRHPPDG
ncbi:unnamed protein product [Linum trigynum]|uniref:Uncharacterized protein n=2 Tax=Linum trigynum TaxID=586398 RepID=A0AAV2DJG6_9ROSI